MTNAAPTPLLQLPHGKNPNFQSLYRSFPTSAYLRKRAVRNVPRFSFEYGDTGAGSDTGVADNWAAFDGVKIAARYGAVTTVPPLDVELFGTRYAAPIGVSPIGGPSLVWPGADLLMAKAAQNARIPYTLGVAGGATIEEAADVAPDVLWLQLYRLYQNDHAIGFDLIKRAGRAGVKALVLTIDAPVRTTRSREVYAGLSGAFRPNARMISEMLVRPKWLLALLRNGYPRFATLRQYARKGAGTNEVINFARQNMGGVFSWSEIARYRDAWKGPMLLKGILHPSDAEQAVSLGIEGIWVSNHGGRQIEALAPSIDVLPAICAAVGKKSTVILDSGIRSGQDVMRALVLGAKAAFAGKSFLWAAAALGDQGPAHLIDLYIDELRSSLGQVGARSLEDARQVAVRHPNAWRFDQERPVTAT